MTASVSPLPPGQIASERFPRFGLPRFAEKFPRETRRIALAIGGEVAVPLAFSADDLRTLPRVEQVSDFHCVTTWSCRGLRWSGVRFADFFAQLAVPCARPAPEATTVILRAQDGYATSLPLADLLVPDVLLADRLAGEPLSIAHGAPLRLVAPAHYGYKNAKHLARVEFWRAAHRYRPAAFRFMDHPRARVAHEERGRGVPGWLLRWLYRPLRAPVIRRFERALERHESASAPGANP